jgi:hypothetical protein
MEIVQGIEGFRIWLVLRSSSRHCWQHRGRHCRHDAIHFRRLWEPERFGRCDKCDPSGSLRRTRVRAKGAATTCTPIKTPSLSQAGYALYSITYNAHVEGSYLLSVTIESQPILNSPFKITIYSGSLSLFVG